MKEADKDMLNISLKGFWNSKLMVCFVLCLLPVQSRAFSLRPMKTVKADEPPPHVTHEDVERFYLNHDMKGLHTALVEGMSFDNGIV